MYHFKIFFLCRHEGKCRYTVYIKTFEGENFCGSSTMCIMLGKLSRFAALKPTHASAILDFRVCTNSKKFDMRAGHMAEAEFETDSSVRGYHVYQDNWTPVIGE